MDIWESIRIRCVRNKEPIKRVARDLGISKNTLKKYLASGVVPIRSKPLVIKPALMSQYEADVDRLIRETAKITASRIVEIIRQDIDADFCISERAARNYVAQRRALIQPKEVFVRMVYVPGDQMQFDFKDVFAIISGVEVKLHMFTARLSYSTVCFSRCYYSEDRSALIDGIVSACVHFNGVPNEGVFDNAKTAVTRVLRGSKRKLHPDFANICGHLALKMNFAAPAKGNEKGGVEGSHGYIEDNFFRPIPEFKSIESLNAELEKFNELLLKKNIGWETVAERFSRERQAFHPLPEILPSTCIREPARTNKFSEVMYKTNRYSVPTQHAHKDVILEVFHDRIRIVAHGTILIAEHKRLFGKREASLDPRHFISVLSSKARAVLHAEVFQEKYLDKTIRSLLAEYVDADPESAGKKFMRVISLLENNSVERVADAVSTAMRRGTSDPAAIELILRQNEFSVHEVPPLQITTGTVGSSRPITNLDAYGISSLKETIL